MSVCEVCGAPLSQLRVTANGQPAGEFYEPREHYLGSRRHHWRQLHNCVNPQPDACPFCPGGKEGDE